MSGLELALAQSTLVGFLLATARAAGFVLTAPPFNTRTLPGRAKATLAMALAIPLATPMGRGAPQLDDVQTLPSLALQVAVGAALGFLVQLAVSVVQMVGDLIDVAGGFSLSMAMDPLMMVQNSVMGRLHAYLAVTLLVATDLHLTVLQGLSRSVQVMPGTDLKPSAMAAAVTEGAGSLMTAAVQVAGPLIAVMLVADVTLGLLTRAAPALNAFALSFPLKIMLTLTIVGMIVVRLPDVLGSAVERGVGDILRVVGAG
ncbi:MAG: flagellar biosynthetic protein FliR [Kineosporiaceae bacterium]